MLPMQVSDDLLPHVHDCYIMHEYPGSDHCPCGIIIKKDGQASLEAVAGT